MAKALFDKTGVLNRIAAAKTFTQGWHDNIRLWRDLYNEKHYTNKPLANEPQYSDPTYTNAVDLTVGILQSNRMSWRAHGFAPSYMEQVDSSKAEKFIAALIEVNTDRNEYVTQFENNLQFTRDGGSVIYQVWDKSLAKKETVTFINEDGNEVSQQVYTEIPIIQQVIDPLNIILLPGGPRRWLGIGRVEMMSVYDIETLYGVKVEGFEHKTMQEKIETNVEFIDWWEYNQNKKGWRVMNSRWVFSQNLVEPTDMTDWYEEIPYTVDLYNPTSRTDSSKWRSVLSPLITSVSFLERSINRRTRQIDVYSSLPFVSKTNTGRPITIDPGLGKVIDLQEGEDFGFPEWRGNPPDVGDQIDFFRARVQQSGYSDVMYGSGTNSVSGYALSQLGDQNRIRLEQPITHLTRFWSRIGTKALSILKKFAAKTPIMVYGRLRGAEFSDMVKGEDLSGVRIECEIKPDFPNEQVRKTAMATQVKGTLSDATIMERYLGIEQPDDERKKKLVEMAEQNQMVLEYAIMAELGDRAENGEEVAKAVLQRIMASGINKGGRPDGLPAAANMNGTPSATGGFSPQESGNPTPGESETDQMSDMANAAPSMGGMW